MIKAKHHLSSWYEDPTIPSDWKIGVSNNGWTNNELSVNWIKHFDQHTKARTKGVYRLLIFDGHESHHSDGFETHCKDNNILTLCMPAHSSHLLQPLDVGCFGPLKKAYGRQIETFMRSHITYISKEDFLPAFKKAFNISMTSSNIQGGFQGAGLVPFDPQVILSKLDVRLEIPIFSRSTSREALPWVSKTPQNPIEATLQSEYIKRRIARYQSSSPISIYDAVNHIIKGAQKIMHSMSLL